MRNIVQAPWWVLVFEEEARFAKFVAIATRPTSVHRCLFIQISLNVRDTCHLTRTYTRNPRACRTFPNSTVRTLEAKLREHQDSSALCTTGLTHTSIRVLESALSESWKSRDEDEWLDHVKEACETSPARGLGGLGGLVKTRTVEARPVVRLSLPFIVHGS